MKAEAALFALLRYEVCGDAAEDALRCLSPETLEQIYRLAKKHDIAHLAGDALSKLGALGSDDLSQKFKQAAFQALYRYARLNHGYQGICKVLEEAKIPFIPLKGSVLRDYYPEPWMRTSCDIDILVHEEDVQSAIQVLTDRMQYQYKSQWFYEYSLFSPDGVHLELHSNTIEKTESKACEEVLMQVWERSVPESGWSYKRSMTDEMFWFYHMQHMAKHFTHGGCGIRPFLDIWVMENRMTFDSQKRQALVGQGALEKFADAALRLTKAWFAGGQQDDLTRSMEQFVMTGGVYGNTQNKTLVGGANKGGRFRHIVQRIFMPYEMLKYCYPVLQRKKWLYPVFQVVRWFRMLFGGGVGRALGELKTNVEVTQTQRDETAQMLEQLGL